MTIEQMHIWFRQYAQQMGMQNVRAILPEQIDLLINTSIQDTINQIIKENIGVTNDRVITDNSKIGQINALRSLYTVKLIDMAPLSKENTETKAFVFNKSDRRTGRMTSNFNKISDESILPDYLFFVDASINYKKAENNLGYTGINGPSCTAIILSAQNATNHPNINIGTKISLNTNVEISAYDPTSNTIRKCKVALDISDPDNIRLKCLDDTEYKYVGVQVEQGSVSDMIVPFYRLTNTFRDGDDVVAGGLLINPLKVLSFSTNGYIQPIFSEDGIETNFFPIRLIDDAYLADTLNDFVLKNRIRSPIMVIYNNDDGDNVYDIYIDEFHEHTIGEDKRYTLQNGLIPYQIRMSYIAKPEEVRYAKDLDGENKDCNLPEYLHVDILKHAVDLYRISVSGALQSARQQEQSAQQENMRNNYRNEGNRQQ